MDEVYPNVQTYPFLLSMDEPFFLRKGPFHKDHSLTQTGPQFCHKIGAAKVR